MAGRQSDDRLTGVLGVRIGAEILELALTHRSYAYEHGGLPTNERLEFLGDSVLGLVVTEHLYRRFPDLAEGHLARLRAAVVNARALAGVGRSLDLGVHLRLGRGEEATGGRDRGSILADTVEALIGAVFLDSGPTVAAQLVRRLFDPLVEQAATAGAGLDWKTSLQELAARSGMTPPVYDLTGSGPDHDRTFLALAVVSGRVLGTGSGRSKKDAEQVAARAAFTALAEPGEVPGPGPAPGPPGPG